jgi:serine O-acetyltransferase
VGRPAKDYSCKRLVHHFPRVPQPEVADGCELFVEAIERMSMKGVLWADISRTYEIAAGNRLQKIMRCVRSPGVHTVVVYRYGQWARRRLRVFRIVLDPLYVFLNALIKILWGIELPRSARIGAGLYIGHFGGITISPNANIGLNCTLSQGITIGVSGAGEKQGVPKIGDDVFIAPGARLFGKITVGNNVKVGANAVVYRDVPDNAVVVLDPGFKIISLKGNVTPQE